MGPEEINQSPPRIVENNPMQGTKHGVTMKIVIRKRIKIRYRCKTQTQMTTNKKKNTKATRETKPRHNQKHYKSSSKNYTIGVKRLTLLC
jgi:hypothetical protein